MAAMATAATAGSSVSRVAMGLTQLDQPDGGKVTVYYPSAGHEKEVAKGPFSLNVVPDGQPVPGNRRLIVVSHGSGGAPWVHADLARTLVERGFVVALPQHVGENHLDGSSPGPQSWRLRPREVSRAIDIVAAYSPVGSMLDTSAVGVFGGSAGGHTALTLAGGQWSEDRFRRHCDANIEQDFSSCVGFFTLLRGDGLDGVKLWLAKRIINWRFTDVVAQGFTDPRIQAAIAMVPFAADFDPASLAVPLIPLGLVIADKDINQVPRFHVRAVQSVCRSGCVTLMDMPHAGHGAMLSPMPPLEANSISQHLLGDPPEFDRAHVLPALHDRIASFFAKHLLQGVTEH